MEIAEAVQICQWQDFWDIVINEYTLSHISTRRRQELWVMLRLKLMIELRSFGEPFSETCKRFLQVAKTFTDGNQIKLQVITPSADENRIDKVEKKLKALVTIYQYFTKISEMCSDTDISTRSTSHSLR
jgi:hypothetical protein